MKVVIVESPAKARKISPWLGAGHRVLASRGHVCDLPHRDGSVEPGNDFAMHWQEDAEKQAILRDIAAAVKSADTVVLATDPDREGEAISWHLLEAMRRRRALGKTKVERVAFNAITRDAVLGAMRRPRQLDQALVDAYLARRALDYLVGFTLSPVLWRRLPGLAQSAGRVQSVALRLVCEREWEIAAFLVADYWQVVAKLKPEHGTGGDDDVFEARLVELDGKRLGKLALDTEDKAKAARDVVLAGQYTVRATESKPVLRKAPPPFTTASLQKDASRKLGMDATRCMQVAQSLYEAGRITYMRTDGVDMAPEAITDARAAIDSRFGSAYLPARARRHVSKVKNAQEAHEAVRPTSFAAAPVAGDQSERLYELIWQRAMASQMADARFERTTIDLAADHGRAVLHAAGDVLLFDGYQRVYTEGRDPSPAGKAREGATPPRRLPRLTQGEVTPLLGADISQHATRPPPRYTEASLVSEMEKLGIGRPSTYASIMQVLRKRDYVRVEQKYLVPQASGHLVVALLKQQFERYVDYDFTRHLEDQLDDVASAKLGWKVMLAKFWRQFDGTVVQSDARAERELHAAMTTALAPWLFAAEQTDDSVPAGDACPGCGRGPATLRVTPGNASLACAATPPCSFVRTLASGKARATPPAVRRSTGDAKPPAGSRSTDGARPPAAAARFLGVSPRGKKPVYLRDGPHGWYVQRGENADTPKPKRVSLPPSWRADEVDLGRALQLLTLPRAVGTHPEGGKVLASIGPHGPYVLHERRYADLDDDAQVFAVTLAQALSRLATRAGHPLPPAARAKKKRVRRRSTRRSS